MAEGVITNITEYHLGTGFKKHGLSTTHPYPQGQHIRGSVGYELLHVNAGLSKSFLDENAALIYFKDAIPLHADGGLLLPFVAEKFQNFKCSTCGQVLKHPTRKGTIIQTRVDRKTGKTSAFRLEAVTRGYSYRFKAVLNMRRGEDYAEEFVAVMELIEENGLKLGRRSGKGKGHFRIDRLNYRMIRLEDIRRRARELERELERKDRLTLHFISDFIGELTGETILTGVKNAGRHFHPEYESYRDPFVRVKKECLPPRTVLSLHRKVTPNGGKNRIMKDMAIPAGAKVQVEFAEKPPEIFYECLAIAELRGIGAKTSFGKGEFVVV